jgi:hypothetical protein
VIDSLAAEGRQQDFLSSRTPSSLPGAARALFVHHLAQNGAVPAHHIIAALSVGRNDKTPAALALPGACLRRICCFVESGGRRFSTATGRRALLLKF